MDSGNLLINNKIANLILLKDIDRHECLPLGILANTLFFIKMNDLNYQIFTKNVRLSRLFITDFLYIIKTFL